MSNKDSFKKNDCSFADNVIVDKLMMIINQGENRRTVMIALCAYMY